MEALNNSVTCPGSHTGNQFKSKSIQLLCLLRLLCPIWGAIIFFLFALSMFSKFSAVNMCYIYNLFKKTSKQEEEDGEEDSLSSLGTSGVLDLAKEAWSTEALTIDDGAVGPDDPPIRQHLLAFRKVQGNREGGICPNQRRPIIADLQGYTAT